MNRYIKARAAEWSSRIGIFLPLLPTIYPLTPTLTVLVWFVAIVVVGVPEDKLKGR
ncbi:MAG: hypothetical protein WC449_05840 [Candidatus Paceibacterota bacterium]